MTDFIVTGAALAVCLILGLVANWKAGQPWNDAKPRVLPWRLIMIFSVFGFVLALVHMLNLAGFETGPEHGLFGRGF